MLVGIAKLAHEGASLQKKARVEYRELASLKLLNRCRSARVPFQWTVNPYRGCEYGCKYCYARYTHEFMEYRAEEDFERLIFAKRFAVAEFSRELRAVRPADWIAIGTATDPYQPAERRYELTRKVLEVFARRAGFNVALTTKSDLVTRDLELLKRVAGRNNLRVNFTVTTMDARLARLLEPMAPRPDLRIEALRALSAAGIETSVFACPVMPGLNDSRETLEGVARAAAGAGAKVFGAGVVFLQPSALAVMLPFLEQEFPRLAAAYREHFERSAFVRGRYPETISRTASELREKYGLQRRMAETGPPWQYELAFGD